MFDFIKNLQYFRYKARSVEDFARIIKDEGCASVSVEPYQDIKGDAKSTAVGAIAVFQYKLEFTATTPRGQKVVYREHLFNRLGRDIGFTGARIRRNAAIKLFLIGEKNVKELQVKLPGLPVNLIGPDGVPINEAMLAHLHHVAAICGVSI